MGSAPPMEVDSPDLSQDYAFRIRELRVGLVESSADLFNDISQDVDNDSLTESAKEFVDHFKMCLTNSPSVFSLQIDPNTFRTESEDIYSENELRIFSKWVYRFCGAFLLNSHLAPFHSDIYDLMGPLLLTLKHNHSHVLVECIQALVGMLLKVLKQSNVPGGFFKLSFKYEPTKRSIQFRTPMSSISIAYILNILKIILPHLDVIKKHNSLLVPLLQCVYFILQQTSVSVDDKIQIALTFSLPLQAKFPQAQTLWCNVVASVIKIGLKSEVHQKSLKEFLDRIFEYEFTSRDTSSLTFLVEFESHLFQVILDPLFRGSQKEFQECIINLYNKGIRSSMRANGLDITEILRKENSIEFACDIFENLPVALPIFSDVIHKEMFRLLNSRSYLDPLNNSEVQSRTPIWDIIKKKWIAAVNDAERILKDVNRDDTEKSIAVKKMMYHTICFIHLLGSILSQWDSLLSVRRSPRAGAIQELIFWDGFVNMLQKLLQIQLEVPKLIDGDSSDFLEWPLVLTRELCEFVGEKFNSIQSQLVYHITFPFFPTEHMKMTSDELTQHRSKYGMDLMEECIEALGSDFIFQYEDKASILNIVNAAMDSDSPNCIKGILKLMGGVKHICRAIPKDRILKYIDTLVKSKIWITDEQIGILLAKALSRMGCILTKANAPMKNGICEICDMGCLYYEPNNCKMKQIREYICRLIQFGSLSVQTEILDSMLYLKRHGLIPNIPLIGNFLEVIRKPLHFKIITKLLYNSVPFLTVHYPKHENNGNASKMFHMIFVHLRKFLKTYGPKVAMDGLIDILDAVAVVSTTKNDLLAIQIAQSTLLVLTLSWSTCVGSKCKLILRSLAETRELKTSEYMGQIREYLVHDFVEMCTFQVFGTINDEDSESNEEVDNFNCKKCEVLLRAVEQAMEFRREDFIRIYFPVLLAQTIPLGMKDKRSRLFITSLAQFALVSVKELLETNFPYYFSQIGVSTSYTAVDLNNILKWLEGSGVSLGILSSLICQALMNDLLSYMSADKDRVKLLLSAILSWNKRLRIPTTQTGSELDIRNYISERLMGYFVYIDCKMDSQFENMDTKRRVFLSLVEVISYLKTLISGMKMRIAKLLNSCTRKPYLQEHVVNGWKAYTMNLDDSVLPSVMNEILASVVHLKSVPNPHVDTAKVLEAIAYYIISEKNRITRDFRYQVYYIQDHLVNRQTRSLLRNAKYGGMKYLEFLIESLRNGNTYVRHQAILAVSRVVKYEDTSVDLKELLEDSQFVHPNVCSLILALLESMQSQDKQLTQLTMSVIGELGAVDYYRMKVKNTDRQSRRDGATIFPTGVAFAHAYIDMLRKQYQGTDLSLPSDIDICAYAIQEVLRIYVVGVQNSTHPIWSTLPAESKSLFSSLITSKFVLKDIMPLDEYPAPLYGSKLGETLQDWCTNFVIQMFKFITSQPAKEIFRVTLPLLVRSLTVALYLLPYVALFAALDGTSDERRIIYKELRHICSLWYLRELNGDTATARTQTPFEDDCHFEDPPSSDLKVADRLAVTNAIFSIIDLVSYVSRYGVNYFTALNCIATTGGTGTPNSVNPKSSVAGTPLTMHKLRACKCIIPDPICLARAAFQTQTYQRALLNLEEYMFAFPEKTQFYLSFLQRILIALEDTDGVIGVSAVRKGKPSIYEETLELLATAKKEDAASKFQLMMQKGLNEDGAEDILMQGYFSIEKPEMALTVLNGLNTRRGDIRSSQLDDCRIEAYWKLQQWGELTSSLKSMRTDLSSRGTLMHAAILSLFQRKRYATVLDIVGQAREKCLQTLGTVDINIDAYHSRYAEITRLHIFTEIEQAVEVMKLGEKGMSTRAAQAYRIKVNTLLKNWKDRLNLVQKSLSIVEPIVNTRKALLHIMKANTKRTSINKLFGSALRECCLRVAKLEIRAKNYGRANACIQEARQFKSPEVYIQDAKFVALRGDMDRGIRIMNECMKQYFPNSKIKAWEALSVSNRLEPEQELCAKSLLLLAKFNDEKCNVDMNVNINNYLQVTEVHKTSEKNFFHLADYCDTLSNNPAVKNRQSEMQTLAVRFFCKSLEYGSKHVYQSLPRLLFVWLNYASTPPPNSDPKPVHDLYTKTVKEMSDVITNLYATVPPYIFLTAYSQLISRICHPNHQVWEHLKTMIVGIINSHHHQALWMIMAVSKSTYKMRKSRCAEILRAVEEKTPTLKSAINDYNALADELIELANNRQSDAKVVTIESIAPSLPRLLKRTNFSPILMPFQQFLTVTISRVGSHHLTHKPFQQSPVFIQSIEKNVDIMPSLQRPKKITLRGNDGRRYGILCKPEDDLRKDSKVMEMNNIVNWYLGKNPEARERNLHVRTYAVVALNEDTGLLEWVPNLQGMRPLLARIYKEKKLIMAHTEVTAIYPGTQATASVKLEGFQKLVNRHPPVLREWFLTYFSDPQEWYTARSTFTRTCAVMSMVGYLIGLGDRHGENISLDSISGDVVHVDFNCLFNKGETFEVPEVVPFRLTQNMVNAMGPLGIEGQFRRACEITVEILRQNSAVFMSVLRPFVFDPLVEWSKIRARRTLVNQVPSTSTTGEVSNGMAMENIKAIQLRLEGVARNLTKELNVPLSVEAQVSYLIKEATSPTNLCLMYIGWSAYY